MIELFDTVTILAQIPNPAPVAPPGSEKIIEVVANAKWGARIALMLGFFIGLLVWAGGRWVDHHRAGRVGLFMMLCSLSGALLYGIGWQVINYFAGDA
ncbi:hypothetical protein [Umezawaea sp. Da 62-37]|uniref:hypothetical protein n=1 Tax=Umezawaea sp. Da 62-37 TaxID=3075927 RepID=UPI0028F720F6|nr:hypothetical protein [Umezawaea sp. Da 62-37]WNV83164.1 hypothetical protein RM788_33940 [Umezawaea sp. Da 62-37]